MNKKTVSFGSIEDLRASGGMPTETFSHLEAGKRAELIGEILNHFEYARLGREDKGLVRQYLQKATGYSRAQVARYITAHQQTAVQVSGGRSIRVPVRGTHLTFAAASVMLLMLMSRSTGTQTASVLNVLNAEKTAITKTDLHQSAIESSRTLTYVVTSLNPNADGTVTPAPLLAISQQTVLDEQGEPVQETLVTWSAEILQRHVAERREARLKLLALNGRTAIRPDVLIENQQFPAYPSTTHAIASAPWDLPVGGTEGQIMMVQNGRIVWRDFPYLEQIRNMPAHGNMMTRRAGGLRSGGSNNGADDSGSTTTIIQQTGGSDPSGWTDGTGIVYLTESTDLVGIGTDDPETKLEVVGAVSGTTIHGETGLSSSGTLVWEGAASGATLWVSQFDGAGLTDCDAITDKLIWDATNKRFDCGLDETVGTGLSQAAADLRYVKKQGDTMTGALTINLTTGTVGLEVIQTISGSTIFANNRLSSSGVLVTESGAYFAGTTMVIQAGSNRVGIGTASPGVALDVVGAAARVLRDGAGATFTVGSTDGSRGITIDSDEAGHIALTSNGNQNITLDPGGTGIINLNANVGIGTTAPKATLDVVGTISGSLITQNGAGNNYFMGNVGVGTVSPSAKFQVNAASDNQATFKAETGFNAGILLDTTSAGAGAVRFASQGTNKMGLIYGLGGNLFDLYDYSDGVSRLTILEDGKVGIGTTAPKAKLDVVGTISGSNLTMTDFSGSNYVMGNFGIGTSSLDEMFEVVRNQNTGTSGAFTNESSGNGAYASLYLANGSSDNDALQLYTLGTNFTTNGAFTQDAGAIVAEANLAGGLSIATRASAPIRFYTDGITASSERLRIEASGNVGVGTTSPGSRLSVSGAVVISANGNLGSSAAKATLDVKGTMSGRMLVLSNMRNCNLETSSTGAVICGTDDGTTYYAGQGLSLTSNVFTLNSTITGALVRFTTLSGSTVYAKNQLSSSGALAVEGSASIDGSTFTIDSSGNRIGIGTASPSLGMLQVEGGASYFRNTNGVYAWIGKTDGTDYLVVQDTLTSTALGIVPGTDMNNTIIQSNGTDGTLSYIGAGKYIINADNGNLVLQSGNGFVGIGTTSPGSKLSVSGAVIIGNSIGSAVAKAQLDVKGTMSGTMLVLSNMRNCNLETSSTGAVICGTDDGTTYYAGQGLSLTSNVFTLNSTITGALVRFNTVSGSTIYAKNLLTSSGTLTTESGAYFDGTTMVIQAGSDRVGIGTSSPAEALHVVGNIMLPSTHGIILGGNGVNERFAKIFGDGGQNDMTFRTFRDYLFETDTGNGTAGTNRLTIKGVTGNLGIGTTSPDTKLEVVGTISGALITQNGAGNNYFMGNVGIGTVSPSRALHVMNTSAAQAMFSGFSTVGSSSHDGEILIGTHQNSAGGKLQYDWNNGDFYIENTWDNAASDIIFRTRTAGTPISALFIQGTGNIGIGSTAPKAKLDVAGTMSGTMLVLSNMRNCNLETSSTGAVICGTDDGTTYYAGQGLSLTSNVFTLNSTITGALVRFTTLSGSTVYARNQLLSSGSLIVEGATTLNGTLTANSTASFQNASDSVTSFQILDADGGSPVFNVDTTNGRVGIGTAGPNSQLDVHGTITQDADDLIMHSNLTIDADAAYESGIIFQKDNGGKWQFYVPGTSNDLAFYNFTTSTEALRIQGSSGNLGIGTTSPGSRLSVSGAVVIGNSIGSAAADAGLALEIIGTASGRILHAQNLLRSSGSLVTESGAYFDGTTMVIQAGSDRVGIGTASPSAKLTVNDSAGGSVIYLDGTNVANDGIAQIQISRPAGSANAYFGVAGAAYGTSLHANRAVLKADSNLTGLVIQTDYPSGGIHFATNGANDRMIIDQNGLVGIGTTSPKAQLDVVGTISGSLLVLSNLHSCSLSVSATGAVICGSGNGSPEVGTLSFSGAVVRLGNTQYVNTSGDTMTGALVIRPTAGASTLGLNVAATISGSRLWITGTGSVPVLVASGGNIGIGTGNPRAAVHVVRSGIPTNPAFMFNWATIDAFKIYAESGIGTVMEVGAGMGAFVIRVPSVSFQKNDGSSMATFSDPSSWSDTQTTHWLTRGVTATAGGLIVTPQGGPYERTLFSTRRFLISTEEITSAVKPPNAMFEVRNDTTTKTGAIIKATLGQTAPIFLIQNSSSSALLRVGNLGQTTIFNTGSTALRVLGTISGAHLHAESLLTSSGTLITESGAYFDGTTMVIQAGSDRVGIGTASPATKLHVHGGSFDTYFKLSNTAAGSAETDGLNIGIYQNGDVGSAEIWNWENGYLRFATNGQERMRILASGNVGINTASPKATLDVLGAISGSTLVVSGLQNCDTINTDSQGNLICGSDQASGSGLDIATADDRYVLKQGDTMTGALVINITGGNANTIGLEVLNTISGSVLHANNLLRSSGSLVTESGAYFDGTTMVIQSSTNRVGIGTATPGATLDVRGVAFFNYNGTDNTGLTYIDSFSNNPRFIQYNSSGNPTNALQAGDVNYINGGNLGIGTTSPETKLEVVGTMSGLIVHANDLLRSSGSLVTESGAYFDGTTMVIQAGINRVGIGTASPEYSLDVIGQVRGTAFNLIGADTVTDMTMNDNLISMRSTMALRWNTADNMGGGYDIGIVRQGTSTLQISNGSTGIGNLYVGTLSGNILNAQKTLASSGTLVWEGNGSGAYLWLSQFEGAGLSDCDAANNAVQWDDTNNRFSCVTIASSGSFGTGNVVTIGDSKYVNVGGDTMTGALVINLTSGTIGLEVIQTISGSTIHANTLLRSSGSLVVEGVSVLNNDTTIGDGSDAVILAIRGSTSASDTSIIDFQRAEGTVTKRIAANHSGASAGLHFYTNGSSSMRLSLYDTSAGAVFNEPGNDYDFRVEGDNNENLFVVDASIDRIGIGTLTPDTLLEIIGTASGVVLRAQNTLASSGTLVWEGNGSGAYLWLSQFEGAGLVDCDTASSVLQWDDTNNRFACATVSATAEVGTLSFSGAVVRLGNTQYVNTSGDTMTGALVINLNGAATLNALLEVAGTMSGRSLIITGTGAKFSKTSSTGSVQPLLATDLDYGAIVIGTGGLRNSGTGTMMPQLYIAGRVPTRRVGSGSFAATAITVQGRYAYLGNGSSLKIVDISNPSKPLQVGSVVGNAWDDLVVQGNYAYSANEGDAVFEIYDVSKPSAPVRVAEVFTDSGSPQGISIQGHYAYVAERYQPGFDIYDIGNPALPQKVGSVTDDDWCEVADIHVQGDYAYITGDASCPNSTFVIFDISNPANPVQLGNISSPSTQGELEVEGRYAYVATIDSLKIIDVSNPSVPVIVGSVPSAGVTEARNVSVQGRYAYVVERDLQRMEIFDISNPSAPSTVGSVSVGPGQAFSDVDVTVQGRYAYVVNGVSLQIFDVGGSYIQQLEVGGLEASSIAARGGLSVIGEADFAGGLTVGRGINATGPSSFINTSTGAYALRVISQTSRTGALLITAHGGSRAPHISFASGTLIDTNLYRSAAATLKTDGSLHVISTISGGTLYGRTSVRSSGSLLWETTASGQSLYASTLKAGTSLTSSGSIVWEGSASGAYLWLSQIEGAGLVDCDTASSVLQWDDTNNRFACATIAATAPEVGTLSFSGAVVRLGNTQYVNTSGDTMTGALVINLNGAATLNALLEVAGTMSGRSLVITGTGAKFSKTTATGSIQPLLATDLDYGAIVIGTGGLRNSGTGTMFPQFYVAGRSAMQMVGSGSGLNNPITVAVQGRYAYVTSFGNNTLKIFDISNPNKPLAVGSTTTGLSSPWGVTVQGRYAYVGSTGNNTFAIFDISNPASPILAGSSTAGLDGPFNVSVQGQFAYVVSANNGKLSIFDISNPANPILAGSTTSGLSIPISIAVQGRYAFVTSPGNNALVIYDITNPQTPALVASTTSGLSSPNYAVVQGRYVYVASAGNDTLAVFDIVNPASPVLVGSATTGLDAPRHIFAQGRYVYLTAENHVIVQYDVSNPSLPAFVGSTSVGLSTPRAIVVQGRYAYVVNTAGKALNVFDLGGSYIQQLEVGGLEAASIAVRGGLSILGDTDLAGGLTVGRGLNVTGPSTFLSTTSGAYALRVVSQTSRTGALLITAHGGSRAPHISFASGTLIDTNLYRSAASTLKTDGSLHVISTISGGTLYGRTSVRSSGSLLWETTASGQSLYASIIKAGTSLASSGSLVWEGAASGSSLYIASSINGVGLTDCDAATSTLQWDATSGRFSCDTTGGNTYFAGQGLSLSAGNVFTLNTTITGALLEFTTVSGSTVHANNLLRSSGALAIEGGSFFGSGVVIRRAANAESIRLTDSTNSDSVSIRTGTGDPNGVVTAELASLFFASDTGRLWKNNNGGTMWVEVTTGSGTVHMAKMSQSITPQTIPADDDTFIDFDTQDYDVGDIASTATDKFVIRKAGKYFVTATWLIATSGTTTKTEIFKNGTTVQQGYVTAPQGITLVSFTQDTLDLVVGDEIQLSVYSSSQTDTDTAVQSRPRMSVVQLDGIVGDGVSPWTDDGTLTYLTDSADNVAIGAITADTKLEVIGTISGSVIRAQNTLASSGSLVWEGTATGLNLYSSVIRAGTSLNSSGSLVWEGTATGLNLYSSVIRAGTSINSSGSVVWEGSASGALLWVSKFEGAGLTDCDTGNNVLQWDSTNKRFGCATITVTAEVGTLSFSGAVVRLGNTQWVNQSGDTMTGALVINVTGGNNNTIGLEVINTISGSVIHANTLLRSSGALAVEGLSFFQNKMTINYGGSASGGVLLNVLGTMSGQQLYVTGSGAATSPVLITRGSNVGIGMTNPGHALDIKMGSIEGTAIRYSDSTGTAQASFYADSNDNIVSFGSITNTDFGFFVNAQSAALKVDSPTGYVGLDIPGHNAGSQLVVSGAVLIGLNVTTTGADTGVLLEVLGTASGRVLKALVTLASSGTLVWEGAASGASLFVGSIQGAGLTDCDDNVSDKLLWDATSGRFICGDDQGGVGGLTQSTADARYVRLAGSTMTGALTINLTAGTVGLEVIQTISGSVIHANTLLRSSGALAIDGTTYLNSGAIVTGKLLPAADDTYDLGSPDRRWRDLYLGPASIHMGEAGNEGVISFDLETNDIMFDTNDDGISEFSILSGASMEADSMSGRLVHAKASLSSSGTVVWEVSASGAYLWLSQIEGAGLVDCDTASSVLQWDDTNNRFACATVSSAPEVGTLSFSGAVVRLGNTQWVKKSGDTMTGALVIRPTAGIDTVGLNVAATMSGRGLTISGTGAKSHYGTGTGSSAPLLATSLPYGTLMMGTGAMKSGTGKMFPQLYIAGNSRPSIIGGVKDDTNLLGITSVTVAGRYAYVTSSTDNSMRIIDISNPVSPVIVGGVKDDTNLASPGVVTVAGRYAYVVSITDNSLRIIDISNPASPVMVGGVKDDTNLSAPFGLTVAGRYAYVSAFGDNSLRIIDISNPASPVIVGGVKDNTNLAGPRGVTVVGRYAYVAASTDNSMRIIDISNPASPVIVSGAKDNTNLAGTRTVAVAGRYAYVTSLTDNSLRIIDISNPTYPVIVGGVKDNSNLSGVRSVAVVGRYAYVASSTNNSMRIIDLGGSYIQSLEVGTIESNSLSLNGALTVMQQANLLGGLSVGRGLTVDGASSITNSSSGAYALRIISQTSRTGALLITAHGGSRAPHLMFGSGTLIDTNLYRSAAATLKTDGSLHVLNTVSGATIHARTLLRSSGSLLWETTASGQSLYASTIKAGTSLTSSGSVVWEGSASGAYLWLSQIEGAGLVDCDTASSVLQWDDTNNRFACATVSSAPEVGTLSFSGAVVRLGNTQWVKKSGDTMTGALRIAVTNGGIMTLGLEVENLLSGSVIRAQSTLASSGGLVWEGSASGSTLWVSKFFGAGLTTDCTDDAEALGWNATTQQFECGDDDGAGVGMSQTDGDLRYIRQAGGTMTGTLTINLTSGTVGLEVIQTISGSTIHANNLLRSSGSLVTESGAYFDGNTLHIAAGPNRIGINNAAPKTALDVVGTISGSMITIMNNNTSYILGNLALGQTTADAKLDVLGTISGSALTVSSMSNCAALKTNAQGVVSCSSGPDTAVFVDTTAETLTDAAADIWDGTYPNIMPISTSQTILVSAQVSLRATTTDDEVNVFRVYRTIGGTTSDCAGTRAGPAFSSFVTNGTESGSAMITFIDSPATTSQVNYTVCSSDESTGTVNNSARVITVSLAVMGADIAENYYTNDDTIEPGDLVSIDATLPAGVKKTSRRSDAEVLGVVSTQPRMILDDNIGAAFGRPVAVGLVGRVPVKVSGENGDIVEGDYLTASSIPGLAMKSTDGKFIVGQAITGFTGSGTSMVLAFIKNFSMGTEEAFTFVQGSGSILGFMRVDHHLVISSSGSLNVQGLATFGSGVTIHTAHTNGADTILKIMTDVGGEDNTVLSVNASGSVYTDGTFNSAGADYAEWFKSSSAETLKPGEVVCIDITQPNTVKRCEHDADTNVMGIVSTNPAFIGNSISGAQGMIPPGYSLVGLIGQVPARVIVENDEAIRPGDSLTAASIPGFARRARAGESTVGVALESLESGEGVVNVLISRRNQSLTVEAVEDEVLQTIADMQIEDEVQLMVAETLGDLNVDAQIEAEVQQQIALIQGTGTTLVELQEQMNLLMAEVAAMKSASGSAAGTVETPWHGVSTGAFIHASAIDIDSTVVTGGDARIGGDLYIDGTISASSLFVPNGLTIDGGVVMNGQLDAEELYVSSGAVVDGHLEIHGDLFINGVLRFGTGALTVSDLIVENSLFVMGDITVQGMATLLGDLVVKGELIVSDNQAGFAMIPKSGTSVTVHFGTGFHATPVVTASPDWPVAYAVHKSSATGFTIRIAAPAMEDITFAWHALSTGMPITFRAEKNTNGQIIFPTDELGIPVSTNMIWNACIRNITLLDSNGQPYNCGRYHDQYTWTQPDLGITFLWNTSVEPALLRVPDGYSIEVTEESASLYEAFNSMHDDEVIEEEMPEPAVPVEEPVPSEEVPPVEEIPIEEPIPPVEEELPVEPAPEEPVEEPIEEPTPPVEEEPTPESAPEPQPEPEPVPVETGLEFIN